MFHNAHQILLSLPMHKILFLINFVRNIDLVEAADWQARVSVVALVVVSSSTHDRRSRQVFCKLDAHHRIDVALVFRIPRSSVTFHRFNVSFNSKFADSNVYIALCLNTGNMGLLCVALTDKSKLCTVNKVSWNTTSRSFALLSLRQDGDS